MNDVYYYDRATKRISREEIYGRWALSLLYGTSVFARIFAFLFLPLLARCPLFSRMYGYLQKRPSSRKKIIPFIRDFRIDPSEFADPVKSYHSFNDFFIRKLKPQKRLIMQESNIAITPVDGRYLVIPRMDESICFDVKGRCFDLLSFFQNPELAKHFGDGSMVMARLNPTDYHRFHFPVSGRVLSSHEIPGHLFSVSPWAIKKRFSIFWENKRSYTIIDSEAFGKVAMFEIGATCVGSIHQTYFANQLIHKGDEKGYFSFGGSSVVLLFEKNRIEFDEDLIMHSMKRMETKCLLGQSLGLAKK